MYVYVDVERGNKRHVNVNVRREGSRVVSSMIFESEV